MIDTNSNTTESLKKLLVELQKVKDLNNLSNEYKSISASLIVALSDYLKDSRAFSSAFQKYLEQTNKSVIDTKGVLNAAIGTIEDINKRITTEEKTIIANGEKILTGIKRLDEQYAQVRSYYEQCASLEIKLKTSIANSERAIEERLNQMESSIASAIEATDGRINKINQSIAAFDETQKAVSNRLGFVHNDILSQIYASKKEVSGTVGNHNKAMSSLTSQILTGIKKNRINQRIIISILLLMILAATFVFFYYIK